MEQCKFCTRTADRVPGHTLWHGILDSRICVDCAVLILKETIDKQDKELRELYETLKVKEDK